MIEGLLLTMVHEGLRVIEDPDNYQARANIMWAGMMAHNNSCGVGRVQDWSSHDMEHELSATYDCAHGVWQLSGSCFSGWRSMSIKMMSCGLHRWHPGYGAVPWIFPIRKIRL